MASLDVPPDFNIFRLLNMSQHPADIEGWSVVLKNDSVRFQALERVFGVSNGILYKVHKHSKYLKETAAGRVRRAPPLFMKPRGTSR